MFRKWSGAEEWGPTPFEVAEAGLYLILKRYYDRPRFSTNAHKLMTL